MNSREVIENVQADLFAIQDLAYRDFQAKLMPTVNKETVIGVRTPSLLCKHDACLVFCYRSCKAV